MIYKYDKENLVYRKTKKLLKYRIITIFLLSTLIFSLTSMARLYKEVENKEKVIKQKDERLSFINSPLREENYTEDLIKAIGHNFTQKEKNQVKEFALEYRDKVEEAKIPMTLVVWIAYKESRFDHKASNSESSAKGWFQFLDGTWNSMAKLAGVSNKGRFDKDKQVDILITYLNYLYRQEGGWRAVMTSYHGGELQYPIKFLVK